MSVRICLRVRERRDVDLILDRGMLAAGWHAHTLDAPGKFLISTPEHPSPRRARAYLLTDDDVSTIAARNQANRTLLDPLSQNAADNHNAARPAPLIVLSPGTTADEQTATLADHPARKDKPDIDLWTHCGERPLTVCPSTTS
jgi:S-DNA-T family DNA segregation ATPase FtsK/SpoIIIE